MPIRFRCAYCNQLMGISRRKVGTIVRCPKCSGQVVVPHGAPTPDMEAESRTDQPAVQSLEDPAMEALLAGAAREAAGLQKPKRKRAPVEIDVEVIPPPAPQLYAPPPPASAPFSEMAPSAAPEMAPTRPHPSPPPPSDSWAKAPVTFALPRWAVAVAALAAALVLGVAFLLGYLSGRS